MIWIGLSLFAAAVAAAIGALLTLDWRYLVATVVCVLLIAKT